MNIKFCSTLFLLGSLNLFSFSQGENESLLSKPKTYRSEYIEFNTNELLNANGDSAPAVDCISLEEATKEDADKWIIIRQDEKHFFKYEIDSIATLLKSQTKICPQTRRKYKKYEIDRMELYVQAAKVFNAPPSSAELEEVFLRYMQNPNRENTTTEEELLMLRRCLTFDCSDYVFSNLGSEKYDDKNREQFINIAQRSLFNQNQIGLWLIRPSSQATKKLDERAIKVRTLSYLYMDSETNENKVCHTRIVHIYGQGYVIKGGEDLSEVSLEDIIGNENQVYPCFLDALMSLISSKGLSLEDCFRVPKSEYIGMDS